MATGGQERRQRPPDQPRRSRDGHPLPRPVGVPRVRLQVTAQQLVPVAEHPVQAGTDQEWLAGHAHGSERQAVVDPVGEDAGRRAVRVEPVQVHPPREGTLDLLVDELAARLVVAVARHPAEAQRGHRHELPRVRRP